MFKSVRFGQKTGNRIPFETVRLGQKTGNRTIVFRCLPDFCSIERLRALLHGTRPASAGILSGPLLEHSAKAQCMLAGLFQIERFRGTWPVRARMLAGINAALDHSVRVIPVIVHSSATGLVPRRKACKRSSAWPLLK